MEILYLLIPLAVVLMSLAIGFFLWTVRSGQYDDLEGPAHRILMDDDDPLVPVYSAKRDRPSANGREAEPPRAEDRGDDDARS